jgi:hypothetical protein
MDPDHDELDRRARADAGRARVLRALKMGPRTGAELGLSCFSDRHGLKASERDALLAAMAAEGSITASAERSGYRQLLVTTYRLAPSASAVPAGKGGAR